MSRTIKRDSDLYAFDGITNTRTRGGVCIDEQLDAPTLVFARTLSAGQEVAAPALQFAGHFVLNTASVKSLVYAKSITNTDRTDAVTLPSLKCYDDIYTSSVLNLPLTDQYQPEGDNVKFGNPNRYKRYVRILVSVVAIAAIVTIHVLFSGVLDIYTDGILFILALALSLNVFVQFCYQLKDVQYERIAQLLT